MTENKTFIIVIMLVWLTGISAQADSISRDKAVDLAFRNNKLIKAADAEYRRASARLDTAGVLTTPTLALGYSSDTWGNDEGDESFEIALSQQFPVTSRLKLEKRISGVHLAMAKAELLDAKRSLAFKLEETVVALSVARYEVEKLQELLTLNEKSASFLEKQVARGESSPLDHMQARITSRQIAVDIGTAKAEAVQVAEALTRILGTDEIVTITYPLDLPKVKPGQKVSLDSVLKQRPDFIFAELKEKEAVVSIDLADSARWADVEVEAFIESESTVDQPAGIEDNTITGIRIAWPLPFRRQNKDLLALAEVDQEEARTLSEAIRNDISSEYRAARSLLESSYLSAAALSGEIVKLAEENYTKLREAYQLGQVGLLEVRGGQIQLLEVRKAELNSVAAYHKALAKYRYITGAYPFLKDLKETNNAK